MAKRTAAFVNGSEQIVAICRPFALEPSRYDLSLPTCLHRVGASDCQAC